MSIYINVYSSNLNCQELSASWLKYNIHIHIHILIHVPTHKYSYTTYTHAHTTYAHTYVARSLTHMYIHTRTHTTPRHAALFARHAVAPAASVVVL